MRCMVKCNSERTELLTRTNQLANEFLDGVADRPVARRVEFETLVSEISGDGIPADGDAPMTIIEQLSRLADRAAVADLEPRRRRRSSGREFLRRPDRVAGGHLGGGERPPPGSGGKSADVRRSETGSRFPASGSSRNHRGESGRGRCQRRERPVENSESNPEAAAPCS